MKTILTASALIVFGSLLSLADVAKAQSLYHVDQLSFRLQRQTVGLVRELQWGYRDTPRYEHLYADSVEMYKLARHIHDLVHETADMRHIAADVKKLDVLFHHVEELVGEMSAEYDANFKKEIATDPVYGFGPAPYGFCRGPQCGYGVGALTWRLHGIERTLHRLLADMKPYIVEPASTVIPLDNVQPTAALQPVVEAQ